MFGKPLPRWFWMLGLAMLVLRFGYKYYQSQQKPASETGLERLETRNQALLESIRASEQAQRASGAGVVVADSAGLAADTAQ